MMKEFDLVISPTQGWPQSLITNLTGHPAISVPNGFDDDDHPTSFTILGNLYDEKSILEAAYIYQSATSFHQQHPEFFIR